MSGLPPVVGPSPIILVLGSFPSVVSLRVREYYGNPRNGFWRVMEALFGVPADRSYAERLEGLKAAGIALWDVVGACTRDGSSDASIREVAANDIPGFLDRHPTVCIIALNGRAAEHWLRRVHPTVWERPGVRVLALPSTSPANARLTIEEKTEAWRAVVRTGAGTKV
ncbi:DNA-deoxyinosine glycosylase [Methanofollis formosanus]|uniref:DNA-deoxyinosine glycosylase n=1 Tax=Methanofollis formosanus TaxID=299308 RepID=A0A8G1A033_9EURY|nr:DNA-deoxyinosine glycosylase [Methanofollis formosanus]QYZ78018.1 DNA-deoxyinosine glycosylase [Methanofollis formosanus]